MAFLLGIESCPKCGDQMSSPIRSFRTPNIYLQTCRNAVCMYCHRTVVNVAPEETPRPVSLPLVEAPRPPAAKSAIEQFERAYQAGETRKLIKRARRQTQQIEDGQRKRLGRDA